MRRGHVLRGTAGGLALCPLGCGRPRAQHWCRGGKAHGRQHICPSGLGPIARVSRADLAPLSTKGPRLEPRSENLSPCHRVTSVSAFLFPSHPQHLSFSLYFYTSLLMVLFFLPNELASKETNSFLRAGMASFCASGRDIICSGCVAVTR